MTRAAAPELDAGPLVPLADGPSRHAAPLRAVDAVEIRSDWEITAEKTVRAHDPYLGGHYPDFTIYPGVFTIETVQQAVRTLLERTRAGRFEPRLAAVRSVRFSVPLLPGDTLRVHCKAATQPDGLLRVKAACRNDRGERTAALTLDYRLTEAGADA